MPRYIDADALKADLDAWTRIIQNPARYVREDALHIIDSTPTADVVPVVRCRECKNFKLYPDGEGTHYGQCLRWMVGGIDDNEYCSYGAKMDGAT